MLKSKKHVFWEALIMTITIFLMGLFLGMLIETSTSSKISNLYMKSEINLVDGLATTLVIKDSNISCELLKKNNVEFADQVYEEALLLEALEDSESLTSSTELLGKKYDLLRTLLWRSNLESIRKCDNFQLVVYLYESGSEDLEKKALQNVWSRALSEVKQANPQMILLPIAADRNLTSLNFLLEEFQVRQLPAIVVDNTHVIYTIETADKFEEKYIR